MHFATIRGGRRLSVFTCVSFLLGAASAHADSITLMWNPSPGTVSGYAMYVGPTRVNLGNTTTYTMTTAVPGQRYCFAVAAYNATGEGPQSGQVCGYSNEFPALTNPGNQGARVGQPASLQLAGSDPDGLPISYTATGLPPGLFVGSATGFISGTPTAAGTYTVTARVSDGVLQSTALTFIWTVTSGSTSDTTSPAISITSPTASASLTSSTTNMSLGGTASDNVGVTSVVWSNSRGGSGSASGTTGWSVPSIGLQTGTNVITVTARDGAGNTATDVLTVTYAVAAADSTRPTVTIQGPTSSATYTVASSPLAISGRASDNVGVTRVQWVSDRGVSGNASGTTNWTASGITLASGRNVITVTARDAAGNQSTDVLTVTFGSTAPGAGDRTAPTISILGPTSSSTYSTTSRSLTLEGTSSDSGGVTTVTWSNNRGGGGVASGRTSWRARSIALQSGTNIITVTAHDAAGNKATDVVTVTSSTSTSSTSQPVIVLTGQLLASGSGVRAALQWNTIPTRNVDLYMNNRLVESTWNDGQQMDTPSGPKPYAYKVCYLGTTNCSNTIVLSNGRQL